MKRILICSLALLLPAITVQAWDILWTYQFGSGIVTGSMPAAKRTLPESTQPAAPFRPCQAKSWWAAAPMPTSASSLSLERFSGPANSARRDSTLKQPSRWVLTVFMLRAGPPEHFPATAMLGVTMHSYESMIQLETCCGPLSWKHWGSTSSFRTQ